MTSRPVDVLRPRVFEGYYTGWTVRQRKGAHIKRWEVVCEVVNPSERFGTYRALCWWGDFWTLRGARIFCDYLSEPDEKVATDD